MRLARSLSLTKHRLAFFSLEGAKQQMGVTTTIEACLAQAEAQAEAKPLPLQGLWEQEMVIDQHLSQVLVDLEANLEQVLQRPIAYTVCDSDAGGLPVGQRYAEAKQAYLSRLAQSGYMLDDFEVFGDWQPVQGDPDREVVAACWRDPVRAEAEVRGLVLMRRLKDVHPTRIYVGCRPAHLMPAEVPASYRQRWRCQERCTRELVNGANLNAHFGYTYQRVPSRTRQRQWAEAQARVEVSQQRLAQHHEAIEHLQHQVAPLRQGYQQGQQAWQRSLADLQQRFLERQRADQRVRRCQQRLARHKRAGQTLTATAIGDGATSY